MEEKKKSRKIILFIICLFFVVLIITIVLPAFKPALDSGPGYARIICNSRMMDLSLACTIHEDEKSYLPDKKIWNDLIKLYVGDDKLFQCLRDKIGPCSYAMNENIPAEAEELPPDMVLLFESAPGWNQTGGLDDVVTDRHGRPGANIAFADGHVEFVEAEKIPDLRWTVEENKSEALNPKSETNSNH
ncbi:MAG: hypothetical protein H8E62_05565 [Planctomycetes bacterium]|nr:hypothetical protein [Planctomycetota bacterium]